MQRAFVSERTDFLDVIDPESTLLEFQTSFERALAHRAQHLARIEKLIGYEVPRDESDASALKTEKPDEGEM